MLGPPDATGWGAWPRYRNAAIKWGLFGCKDNIRKLAHRTRFASVLDKAVKDQEIIIVRGPMGEVCFDSCRRTGVTVGNGASISLTQEREAVADRAAPSKQICEAVFRIGVVSLLLVLPAHPQNAQSLEQRIFQSINQVRQHNRLPPLKWSSKIAEVARSHSARMATKRFFSHEDPNFGGPDNRLSAAGIAWRLCGENIFEEQGHADPVRAAVRGWMQSSGHRKNILARGFTHTGIGVAIGRDGLYTITQLFAAF